MIYLYKNLINSFFKLIYGKITKLKNIKHSNELKIYHIKYNQYKLKLYAIKKGRVLVLDKCDGIWCKVKSEKFKGWIKTNDIWGSTN